MSVVHQLASLSKGNPGAMNFLMALMQDPVACLEVLPKIESYGIVGTDLYILWSDLCNRNTSNVRQLLSKCPKEIVIEACSRQDYSGRELIAPYVNPE